MNTNALKQWLDFYDQNMGGNRDFQGPAGYQNKASHEARRAMFAMDMASRDQGSPFQSPMVGQGQMSNMDRQYQPYQAPQYVQPSYMSQQAQSPQSMQDRGDPMMQGRDYGAQLDARRNPQQNNFLAQLLGGMNGLR